MPARAVTVPHPDAVLAGATRRVAERLGMTQRELARTIGLSEASVSRLARGRGLDPHSKEGELAALFLRAWRSLDALVGGDEAQARAWFAADNTHLGGCPAALVLTVEGLVGVVEYLDGLRGRL